MVRVTLDSIRQKLEDKQYVGPREVSALLDALDDEGIYTVEVEELDEPSHWKGKTDFWDHLSSFTTRSGPPTFNLRDPAPLLGDVQSLNNAVQGVVSTIKASFSDLGSDCGTVCECGECE